MSIQEFALPDLGEGLTESELVEWRVAVGDTVELNQVIAEVETAKALVQLPSPFAGIVTRLYAEPGVTVRVGAPLVAVEVPEATPVQPEPVQPAPVQPVGTASGSAESSPTPPERQSVLVGYGPLAETADRPRRAARSAAFAAATERRPPRSSVAPPIRALAREQGVDLAMVRGTGEHGAVTREDVAAAASVSPSPSEREHRTPIRGMRKATAAAMVDSAFTAPQATVFLTVDVTPTVELIASLSADAEFRERRLTILTMVAKAVTIAVAHTPEVNSRWDEAAGEIVSFDYVHLGVAAATPRGLLVPIIRDAERLSLRELAEALAELRDAARSGVTTPAALRGGTISLSNVGVFGVDAGTPILNPGEAAILALGAVRWMPWEHRGEIALRQVLTLSLTFDHRVVDGEQGSRFLADVGRILAEPGRVLTMV
jgi:2-oxoisovalerate dehydrogenase E2 component (dihydrolipoyl transacylase)